ncbi:permuted papain-like amidase YaeF/Yiix C92 family enzyme [Thioclava sp. ES.031]|uniref:lipo-like protein n=1 Tax=Thioclava sp. ES.031 TaxID=1798203 RepID=UPI000BF894D4|nr:lipo-like protein [Thioclava sp. ES.031]PFG62725.1 permuted papain-like amidase YaeF/Yiix C92 family enzyme [Thioclava sp. ES.031]
MAQLSRVSGKRMARFLQKQTRFYQPFGVIPTRALRATLRPGDVLLVEGDRRISAAIKYLTHSTWSHAAFYSGGPPGGELIEADLEAGVRIAGLAAYAHLNTRICRPVGLGHDRIEEVIDYMQSAVGRQYDLKNVVDLARYLLPRPPVPHRFRRRMLALGSGDPTRAICSTVIAEAFHAVHYPILPDIEMGSADSQGEILHIRHSSLFTPRDFDLSPYFDVIKPTLEDGFDFRKLPLAE